MNLSEQNKTLFTANLKICPELGQIESGDKSIRLGPVNMRVLLVLLENHGQLVSRVELFEQVWKNQIVSDDTLTRCISDLRGQLGQYAEQVKLIETIPKRGYRWIAEVSGQQITNQLPPNQQKIQQDLADIEFIQPLGPASDNGVPSPSKSKRQWKHFAMWLMSGIILLSLLSTSTLWIVNQMVDSDTVRVALLPMQTQNKQQQAIASNFEDLLKEQLLATENIRFLSSRTIDGNRQNLYPYLSREFAAEWIIEGRIRGNQETLKITLNLVDARTALVSRSFTRNYVSNQTTLNKLVVKFVKELESSLNRD